MAERIWKRGPPPHIGWWLCRTGWWRWWDGKLWSQGIRQGSVPQTIQRAAAKHYLPLNSQEIEWCDYWPQDARVPRLDPRGGHWTFNTDGLPPAVGPCTRIVFVMAGVDDAFVASAGTLCWWKYGVRGDIAAWRLAPAGGRA